MKLGRIVIFVSYLCLAINLNAQITVEEDALLIDSTTAKIDYTKLCGRWHQAEVILRLDTANGIGTEAKVALQQAIASQEKVKKQIENGALAIVTQLNYDSTFTHELIYANPKIRFPYYKETGKWSFNRATNQLSRQSTDQEVTSLELTLVKRLDEDELILELRYDDEKYRGIVETIMLKKIDETKAKY